MINKNVNEMNKKLDKNKNGPQMQKMKDDKLINRMNVIKRLEDDYE